MRKNDHNTCLLQVVNDRWGSRVPCNLGDFYTCSDNCNPGHLVTHKRENCFTVRGSVPIGLLLFVLDRRVLCEDLLVEEQLSLGLQMREYRCERKKWKRINISASYTIFVAID